MYTVIRDTREQKGRGWIFPANKLCSGTLIKTLKTGDYTLLGFESVLCIERKATITEFAANLLQKRFEAELVRMDSFKYSFLVLEFTMKDLMTWPYSSGLPAATRIKIKTRPEFLLRRLIEIETTHTAKVIFAGCYGMDVVNSIFKRVVSL